MKDFPYIFLKSKEDVEIKQGFPWVFYNEIQSVKTKNSDGTVEKISVSDQDCSSIPVQDGQIVEVYSNVGAFLGTGVLNKKSKIIVRFIGKEHADVIMSDPESYWSSIVHAAASIRRVSFSETDSYRLIYAEADFLPGLVVERYFSDGKVYLVVQFLALSCDVFRNEILSALKKICNPYGIYERSDGVLREKEGLPQKTGWIGSERDSVITIVENGMHIRVDVVNGQKTGYFLDQKCNRSAISRFCHGKRVLDTFSHTGAFGLNAVKGGAKSVISVDISQEAVDTINVNIALNNAQEKMTAVCADVFDVLKDYESKGEKFDVIILDPPAFTKSAKLIQKAYGGYKEINLRAMRLLNEGGILVTCSCSYYFDENTFYSMLMHAAMDSHKRIQVLEKRGAAPDHPVLLGYPKSEYLKCAICRVV
ncbi:MAG: class I SAM-dependent rRNA methyltransferase [Treponema sp.]|nr:class I SAM-dependent rRNA methyltransferase [Treponema sp.]